MKPSPLPVGNTLVDRAARAAMRESEPEPDLLLAGFPFTPALWNIVIEPLRPRSVSDGGIEVVDISMEAEQIQVTVGRVLKCGPSAFAGRTTSGIDLGNFTQDIQSPGQILGKHVVHKRYAGMELTLRKTGQIVRVMVLGDLLGVTDDPYAWKFYI